MREWKKWSLRDKWESVFALSKRWVRMGRKRLEIEIKENMLREKRERERERERSKRKH